MQNRIGCICVIFLQSVCPCVSSNGQPWQMHSRTGCTCRVSSQSEVSYQIIFPNRCKIALVAFVRFYSRVHSNMSLQMARMNRCIVALVAFVRFFPRVSFQTCFSAACQKGISNMDSFWTISGFFGPPELFLEVSEGFKIFNPKFWEQQTDKRFSKSENNIIYIMGLEFHIDILKNDFSWGDFEHG